METVSRVSFQHTVWLFQLQGCLVCLGLGLAWCYASLCRRQQLKKINDSEEKGNHMAFITTEEETLSHESQRKLPKVSVILAVKGAGEQGNANWRSQLVTLYGGQVEFLFCMESKDDPAYDAVNALKKEMAPNGAIEIRTVVAGLASHCSQQIHNQVAGAKAISVDSKYILFLDDDIQCHPGTIGSLVETMETREDVFVATGYSFDLPSQPTLAAYAAMAYRLPLLVGLSSGAQVFFVWGGCIFLRSEDLRTNRHGMMTALQQNGYSNDLILTSVAGLNNRKVWSTPVSIFPGRMSGGWTMVRYWNYVRRQIFALLTYCSSYAYRTNRTGWVCYMYLSWACIMPLAVSSLHICSFLVSVLWSVVVWIDNGGVAMASIVSSPNWFHWLLSHSYCPVTLAMAAVNLLSMAFLTTCGVHLFSSVIKLCNKLSPELEPFRLDNVSLPLSIAGMVVNLFMLPVIALYTYFKPDITWAGIRYVRRNGVVAKVTHPGEENDIGLQEVQKLPGRILAEKDGNLRSENQIGSLIAAKLGLKKLFPLHFEIVWRTRGQRKEMKKLG